MTLGRGKFRVRGDTIEVHPSYEEHVLRIEMFGDTVDRITVIDPITGENLREHAAGADLPGHPLRRRRRADARGGGRHRGRAAGAAGLVRGQGQAARGPAPADAHPVRPGDDPGGRLLQRHRELLDAHRRPHATASRRSPCSTTSPKDFLLVIDESHQAVPQLHGQYEGDRSRKDMLVEHGFRLPSAPRQPAAALRGGARADQPVRLPVGHAGRVRAASTPPRSSSRSSGPPG